MTHYTQNTYANSHVCTITDFRTVSSYFFLKGVEPHEQTWKVGVASGGRHPSV